MQVTKGTWRMREQCVPGSLSSSPAQEPGNKASICTDVLTVITTMDQSGPVGYIIIIAQVARDLWL